MAYLTEDQMPLEEENKHARRGCVIAFFLIPIICALIIYPFYQFTSAGRRAVSNVVLIVTETGVIAPIPYLRGLPNVAQAGCVLDRANPRPADYQTQLQNLEAEYDTLVDWYDHFYSELKSNGGDTSLYPTPDEVPGAFGSAKLVYCTR